MSENLSKKIIREFPEKFNYYFNSYGDYNEEDLQMVKMKSLLLLSHMAINNKENTLNDLPIEKIFTKDKDFYNENKINYKTSLPNLLNFIAIIENVKENEELKVLSTSFLWEKFEQKAVEHLIKASHSNKNIDDFVSNNKKVMLLLLDNDSKLFQSIINDDFIQKISKDKELNVKLSYVLLTNDLNENQNPIKKTNKI